MPTFTQTRHPGGGLSWGEKATEEEELQLELLRKEIANMDSQSAGNAEVSAEATEMSKKYLGEWNKGLEQAGGMFNTAIKEMGSARDYVSGAYKDVTANLGSMGEDMKSEWESMKSEYSGVKGDLIGGAKEDMANRGELTRQFMDLTKADYEGASGRAMADVASQSEAGRKAEAMRMSGLGVDPTSGRSRSFMRTSRNDEALNKAMAGNQARVGEKERVSGLTARGLELIDPTKNINAATGIQNLQNSLLTTRSNLSTNLADIQSRLAGQTGNLATQQGNLAGSFAQNVVAPKGEMGAAQLGVSQATRPVSETTSSGGSSKMELFNQARARATANRKQFYGT
jgi:hypothetical protein